MLLFRLLTLCLDRGGRDVPHSGDVAMSPPVPHKGGPGYDHEEGLRFGLLGGQAPPVPLAGGQARR